MIAFTLVDYILIGAIFLVLLLRLVADIREVKSARALKRITAKIIKRSFTPTLSIIVPLESLEDIKQTILRLQSFDMKLKIVAVVDSTKQPKAASRLRYFVRKNVAKNVKVVARKQPDFSAIAASENSRLTVILPDTVQLHGSFYSEAVLLFADSAVDAVSLPGGIRPGKTLSGGFEALTTAWQQYTMPRSSQISLGESWPEAVIVRTKYLRRTPKKPLNVLSAQKAVYSISAQQSTGRVWGTTLAADGIVGLMALGTGLVLLLGHSLAVLMAGVLVALFGALMWWSLGVARLKTIDRISVLLMAPLLLLFSWVIIIFDILNLIYRKTAGSAASS